MTGLIQIRVGFFFVSSVRRCFSLPANIKKPHVIHGYIGLNVRIMYYITNTRAGILDCDYGYDSDVIDTAGSIKETIITEENALET